MKRILFVLIILILTVLITRLLVNKFVVNIDDEIVRDLKENTSMMKKIGGYKEHIFAYKKYRVAEDSLTFDLQILGEEKRLIIKGYANKIGDDWKIHKTTQQIDAL